MDNQEPIIIKCTIDNSNVNAELGLRVMLNGTEIMNVAHVTSTIGFEHSIPDQEQQHELAFEMYGKKEQHTEIDASGNIVKDAYLSMSNFSLDGIDLQDWTSFEYLHNNNGAGPQVNDKFFGYVGCNGSVTLKFTTPIYLWLLENM
jgi:hypothetical protein